MVRKALLQLDNQERIEAEASCRWCGCRMILVDGMWIHEDVKDFISCRQGLVAPSVYDSPAPSSWLEHDAGPDLEIS